jgi:hypothetical protein
MSNYFIEDAIPYTFTEADLEILFHKRLKNDFFFDELKDRFKREYQREVWGLFNEYKHNCIVDQLKLNGAKGSI